jgi:hypothetical protein
MGDVAAADPSFRCLLLRYFNPAGGHPSGERVEERLGSGCTPGRGCSAGVKPLLKQSGLAPAQVGSRHTLCAVPCAGRIGEHPQQPTNLVPCITEAVLGRRPTLQASAACAPATCQTLHASPDTRSSPRPVVQVFGTDYPTRDGTCLRDYIHVVDLVRWQLPGSCHRPLAANKHPASLLLTLRLCNPA